MTEVGSIYGESMYGLAKEENLAEAIGEQLQVLQESFRSEPAFIRLLSSPTLSKAERIQILDDSFRSRVHPYLLNFLKILTEKGYMRYFSDCCDAYTEAFDKDNGILRVTAVTAVPLTQAQSEKLTDKLGTVTGKRIALHNRIDTAVLGGIRLDYDGRRLDDTVSNRMAAIRDVLKKTVL